MQSLPWQDLKTILYKLLVFAERCTSQYLISTIIHIIENGMPEETEMHPWTNGLGIDACPINKRLLFDGQAGSTG